jgi:hypothetical protein
VVVYSTSRIILITTCRRGRFCGCSMGRIHVVALGIHRRLLIWRGRLVVVQRMIRIIGEMRILGMGMLLPLPLQLLLLLRPGWKEVGIHVSVSLLPEHRLLLAQQVACKLKSTSSHSTARQNSKFQYCTFTYSTVVLLFNAYSIFERRQHVLIRQVNVY